MFKITTLEFEKFYRTKNFKLGSKNVFWLNLGENFEKTIVVFETHTFVFIICIVSCRIKTLCLYVLFMSRTRFRVNLHSRVA